MVRITIRLIGEEKDKLYERIELNPQIHVDDLVKRIEHVTKIPIDYQEIKYRGVKIPDSLHPLESIKYFEELVVCHAMLVNWRTYVQMINEIKRMTTSGVTVGRREIALKARIQLSPLHSSKFFVVYPSLAIEEMRIGKSLNFLIHNTKKYLHRSVSTYFEEAYPEKTVELKDKSEEFAGVHLGVFVFIDQEPSYYAKTLGNVPGPDEEFDFPNFPKIDLMEIYVYFLLKLIGVGPVEVYVIPDTTKSDLVFISTKLVDGFRTASGVSVSEIIASTSSEVVGPVYIDMEMKNQMKILSSLLCLSDLLRNKGNHGVVEQQITEFEKKEDEHCSRELRIIDFGINLRMIDVDPCILNSSFDIAYLKTFFAKWNLQKNIYRAREAMNNVPVLKNNQNVNRATFDRYFERLEKALTTFLK